MEGREDREGGRGGIHLYGASLLGKELSTGCPAEASGQACAIAVTRILCTRATRPISPTALLLLCRCCYNGVSQVDIISVLSPSRVA